MRAEHPPVDRIGGTVAGGQVEAPEKPPGVRQQAADIERERILGALGQSGGKQTRAAEILGMPLRTLVRRLVAHGVTRPRKGPATAR
jgi:two-component system, NtrC family, response regulator AtoC